MPKNRNIKNGQKKKKTDKKSDEKEPAKDNVKEFDNSIVYNKMGINRELFQECFNFQEPTFMLKDLLLTNGKKKNNDLVNVIKGGLSDLKDEVEEVPENQIVIEKPDKNNRYW